MSCPYRPVHATVRWRIQISGERLFCLGILFRTKMRTSTSCSDHCLHSPRGYAVTPLAFRTIQRLVGGSENIAHRRSVVGKESHTDRDADGPQELPGILHTQLFHLLAQNLRPLHCARQIRIGEDEHEFLSTITAGDILATRAPFQEISERTKKRVTRLVSKCIVEPLEMVQVHHEDLHISFVAICP